jgi:hypothetical protein
MRAAIRKTQTPFSALARDSRNWEMCVRQDLTSAARSAVKPCNQTQSKQRMRSHRARCDWSCTCGAISSQEINSRLCDLQIEFPQVVVDPDDGSYDSATGFVPSALECHRNEGFRNRRVHAADEVLPHGRNRQDAAFPQITTHCFRLFRKDRALDFPAIAAILLPCLRCLCDAPLCVRWRITPTCR